MDPEFWLMKWHNNETGFHEQEANPNLTQNIHRLSLAPGSRIFVPLCGKTLDIPWLIKQGYYVVAAELSTIAIAQLCQQLDIIPDSTKIGDITRYDGPGFTLFGGDIFHITPDMLGNIDAVYDRAALVALPFEMRVRYTKHLRDLTGTAPQLLITFDYDQQKMDGPPFAVIANEVEQHYIDHYSITLLHGNEINLKGKVDAQENVWLLKAGA
ncbi:thiopurine S-methyltransferase [Alteromonas confluentis]|uniref:Thiopurine S-methyltransferase n=1 Tax=Alteromonas confluentis TaxID=1656094 RepID=A0A1E7ZEV6_9ALTE|nr:thiopurine S-methyltransferase [Alteromonas confluentis]OFC72039.1 thiopurine S-methyltransferase [Alteromonas confluentis]